MPLPRRHLLALATGTVLATLPFAGALAEDSTITVYKSPWCGCCDGWVRHLEDAGFAVAVHEVEDLTPVKAMAGVPATLASCHTASGDGWVVEGHVPADVVRLLAERPTVDGIAVPGMPIGSPGMEGPNPEPYTVYAFKAGAEPTAYAHVIP